MEKDALPYVQSKTATVPDAGTQSNAVRITAQAVIGVITPASMEGVLITFEGSQDGTTFRPIKDKDGVALTIDPAASSEFYYLDPVATLAWEFVRLVVSAQTGAAAFTLRCRRI